VVAIVGAVVADGLQPGMGLGLGFGPASRVVGALGVSEAPDRLEEVRSAGRSPYAFQDEAAAKNDLGCSQSRMGQPVKHSTTIERKAQYR